MPQFVGGIRRVSAILGNEWRAAGHTVCLLSFCTSTLRLDRVESLPQYFLPDTGRINSPGNLAFFADFVSRGSIDIVLNQFGGDAEMSELCRGVRHLTQVKLVSALHFAVTHQEDVAKSAFFALLKMRYPLTGKGRLKTFADEILFYVNYRLRGKRLRKRRFRETVVRSYDASDAFVLLSGSQKEPFQSYTRLADTSKLAVINNPVVLPCGGDPVCDVKRKEIVWCGRMEYGYKRLDRMIGIWKELAPEYPDWTLNITGTGDTDYFGNIVRREQVPGVCFSGFRNADELYRCGSILCMTSSSEGWGMVLVEAMAHGCVPVAYDSFTALGDIIEEGHNGFRVLPYKKSIFAERLRRLMDDEELRSRMAENGRDYVRRFDKETIAAEWIALFGKLLNK
ncbi:glycosyltransferase [uncultured Alistipes sp.]|uniref:glycosyltransferase n=1 Tax=uncultured Alistipes sp. TaxID=538949 RepID=UPI0025D89A9F|nr:glycosyltransferase [uncultured Alistipes sp.]